MKKYRELIEIFKDQDHDPGLRIAGTIVIIIVGTMPILDKIFTILNIQSSYTFGFTDFPNFVWALSQSTAPILLIAGFLLRPYFLSYFLPVYTYSIQIFWILGTSLPIDNPLLHIYAIGACFIFTLVVMLIFTLKKKNREKIENDRLFIKEMEASIELLTQKSS